MRRAGLRRHLISSSESISHHLQDAEQHLPQIPFVFGVRSFWPAGSSQERTSEEVMRRWASFASDGAARGLGERSSLFVCTNSTKAELPAGPDWVPWTPETQARLGIEPAGATRMEQDAPRGIAMERRAYWLARIRSGGKMGLGS